MSQTTTVNQIPWF